MKLPVRRSTVLLRRVLVFLLAALFPAVAPGNEPPRPAAPGGSFLRSPARGPEIRGSERSRPPGATRLLRGRTIDYGVWFDPKVWEGMWARPGDGVANADLVFVRPLMRAYAVAEPFPISFANLGDAFINRIASTCGSGRGVIRSWQAHHREPRERTVCMS